MSNKFQLGTVMPGTQAVPFQYKPLGLEAFAQPLAQKQQRFDQVFDAVDQAQFDIKGLSPDDESSKKLMEELEEHKAALLADLDKTSNYRDATRRLKKLNDIYNKDGEITAIRTQRANFAAADEEMRKRIDGDKYTQEDYERWKFKTLGEYRDNGGLGYNRETGQHNSVNTELRGANLESEIIDLAMKAAQGTPLQVKEYMSGWLQGEEGLQERVQTLIKNRYLDPQTDKNGNMVHQGIAKEVADLLRQSDRYQNWVDETSEYDFYWKSRHEEGFADRTMKEGINNLAKGKQFFDIVANSPTASAEDKAIAAEKSAELAVKMGEFNNAFLGAQANGTLEDFAKAVYKENAITNRLSNMGYEAADLYDVTNLTMTPSTRENSAYGNAKKNIEDIPEYEINTHAGITRRSTTPWIAGGGSTASELQQGKNFSQPHWGDQQELWRDMQKELPDVLAPENVIAKTILETAHKKNKGRTNLDKAGVEVFNRITQTTQDFHSMMERSAKHDRAEAEIRKTIAADEEKLLSTTLSTEQRRELQSEISGLKGDLIENGIAREGEFFLFNTMIDEAATKDGNEWINEMLSNSDIPAKQRYAAVYEEAYNRNLAIMQSIEQQVAKGESSILDLQNRVPGSTSTLVTWTDHKTGEKHEKLMGNIEFKDFKKREEGKAAAGYADYSENISGTLSFSHEAYDQRWRDRKLAEFVMPMPGVMDEWKKAMTVQNSATPIEVTVDKAADKYTQGEFQRLIDFNENQKPGTSGAPLTVKYDPGTGKASKIINSASGKYIKYNLDNYGTPDYVGTQQIDGHDRIIMRYNMAEIPKATRDARIRKNKGLTKDDEITNAMIKEFKQDNPRELFLATEGTSYDIHGRAEQTFTSKAKDIMQVNDVSSPQAFSTMLDGYAAIDLLSNNDRHVDYGEMSTTLKRALELGNSNMPVHQGPAAWTYDAATDRYTGFSVEYHYDQDEGAIVADIKRITRGRGIPEDQPLEQDEMTRVMRSINPQAIRGMDIFYGVGSERDVVYDPSEMTKTPFIPALYNPTFAQRKLF
jgi:hypothetical protein